MGNTPLVTVVMSVYNGARYLRQAVDSILNQSFSDFEFIIIDDGSTDDSMAIINTYQDTRIRLVENVGNLGLPTSLNRGIREAKGKYIARQDADDVSLPARLEEKLHYTEQTVDRAVVGSGWEYIDIYGDRFGQVAIASDHSEIMKDLIPNKLKFPHGCYFMRKEALEAIGGYDERFFYTQDYDLLLRMSKEFKLGAVSSVLYQFRTAPWQSNFKILCQAHYRAIAQKRYANDIGDEIDVPTVAELKELYAYDIQTFKFYKSRYWYSISRAAWQFGERSQSVRYISKCLGTFLTRRPND